MAEGYDQGQLSKNKSEEIVKVLQNYQIIVDRVNAIDGNYKAETTRRLLDSIFVHYVRTIEHSISVDSCISDEDKRTIDSEITKLKNLRTQTLIPNCDDQSKGQEWHESPLVLLLSLALEDGTPSTSDPRGKGKHSTNSDARGQDWGRLSGFLDYLSQLEFKTYKTEIVGSYWPGLPKCIMALIPLEIAEQNEFKIMISASLDKFEHDATQDLKGLILDRRVQRLQCLETKCSKSRQEQIGSVRDYSDKTWTERDLRQTEVIERKKSLEEKRKQWNAKKQAAFEELNKTRKRLTELKKTQKGDRDELDQLSKKETALLENKRKIDEEAKKEEAPLSAKISILEKATLSDADNAHVPVYFPAIVSTWHPDGSYLPTCFLDCRRFRFLRPLGAEKLETPYKSKEREAVYPATACAEWDGYVNWIAQCCREGKT